MSLVSSFEGSSPNTDRTLDTVVTVTKAIEREIRRRGVRILVADFRDLQHMDTTVAKVLLAFLAEASSSVEVKFVGPGPAFRNLLRVVRSLPPLRFFTSVARALRSEQKSFDLWQPEWASILRDFGPVATSVRGFAQSASAPLVVDLDEEAQYLRSAGDPGCVRTYPVEFRN
ncbi:MAG: STAS domain-containing protein [Planctomycetota bacterium]